MRKTRLIGRVQAALHIFQHQEKKDFSTLLSLAEFMIKGYSLSLHYWYVQYLLFRFSDTAQFTLLVGEVFHERCYEYTIPKEKPTIVDIGSNIGLSVCFFKSMYPKARIIGFEPNPQAYKLLQENLKSNHITGTKVYEKAVVPTGVKKKVVDFFVSSVSVLSTQSKKYIHASYPYQKIKVTAIPFTQAMKFFSTIDLLKIDIEGGEYALVDDISTFNKKIKRIVIEFHTIDQPLFFTSLKKLSKYYTLDSMYKDLGSSTAVARLIHKKIKA